MIKILFLGKKCSAYCKRYGMRIDADRPAPWPMGRSQATIF
jgi:hypothetical protein